MTARMWNDYLWTVPPEPWAILIRIDKDFYASSVGGRFGERLCLQSFAVFCATRSIASGPGMMESNTGPTAKGVALQ